MRFEIGKGGLHTGTATPNPYSNTYSPLGFMLLHSKSETYFGAASGHMMIIYSSISKKLPTHSVLCMS